MENVFMRAAIDQARYAMENEEVPVGAVIVLNNKIIATGQNHRELKQNSLAHAEIEAINNACEALGSWRLDGCDLYVTLEPCPMCAGAIINARIHRVFFGAYDKKAGSCGSVSNLFEKDYNHKPQLFCGIMEQECAEVLKVFFKNLRQKKKSSF